MRKTLRIQQRGTTLMQEIRQPRNIGSTVRTARLSQGLTQRQLAEKAGVSERSVLSLELGDATGMRFDKLCAILDSLGLHLFVGNEPETHAIQAEKRDSKMMPPSSETSGEDASGRNASDAWPIDEDTSAPIAPQGKAQPYPPLDIQYQQLYNELVLNAQSGGAE